jgi:CRP-like cAMP-binding protein
MAPGSPDVTDAGVGLGPSCLLVPQPRRTFGANVSLRVSSRRRLPASKMPPGFDRRGTDIDIAGEKVQTAPIGSRQQTHRCGVSSMDQTFQLFSECALFRNLEHREKEALFTCVRIRDFAASETIFAVGSPGDSMMIVLRGTVQISVSSPFQISVSSPKGQRHVLAILSPGQIFGEISVLDGEARSADAIAITNCSLAIVDRPDLLAFFEQNPGAWQTIALALCKHLRHASRLPRAIALAPRPVPA